MDGERDWIAARFVLSTILGVHPLVMLDDDDERFPVDNRVHQQRVTMPAAVEAPEGIAGVSVCAVCTEEVAAGQAVVRPPCAHWYHASCIAPWLRIRTTCPTCRVELPQESAPERSRPSAWPAMETAGRRLRHEQGLPYR
jgi:hypothetical protein